LYFLIQECLVDNIASLDNTNQYIVPPKHGEPTKVYTKCTSTVPLSFVVPVSTPQSGENTLPSGDVTLVPVLSDFISDIFNFDLLIAL